MARLIEQDLPPEISGGAIAYWLNERRKAKEKQAMAEEAGVPYQSLINLYLRDCVTQHRQIQIAWPTKS